MIEMATETAIPRETPSAVEIQRALDAAHAIGERERHLPSKADIYREFGNIPADEGRLVEVNDPETGEYRLTIEDYTITRLWMNRFFGFTQGYRNAEYARGQNDVENTFTRRDRMKNRITGEMDLIPEGFEGESFKRKWTTKGRTFGFGETSTAPLERTGEHHTVRREPAKVYTADQWRFDCDTCGEPTDRWQESGDADTCTRCVESFDRYRRGVA